PAVYLYGLIGATHRKAAGLELGLRGCQPEVAFGVLLQRGLVNEQPRCLDLARHVGELALDRPELGDRGAECRSLLGVEQRLLKGALCQSDAHRRHPDSPDVEHREELPESRTTWTEQGLFRHPAVAERQR